MPCVYCAQQYTDLLAHNTAIRDLEVGFHRMSSNLTPESVAGFFVPLQNALTLETSMVKRIIKKNSLVCATHESAAPSSRSD